MITTKRVALDPSSPTFPISPPRSNTSNDVTPERVGAVNEYTDPAVTLFPRTPVHRHVRMHSSAFHRVWMTYTCNSAHAGHGEEEREREGERNGPTRESAIVSISRMLPVMNPRRTVALLFSRIRRRDERRKSTKYLFTGVAENWRRAI